MRSNMVRAIFHVISLLFLLGGMWCLAVMLSSIDEAVYLSRWNLEVSGSSINGYTTSQTYTPSVKGVTIERAFNLFGVELWTSYKHSSTTHWILVVPLAGLLAFFLFVPLLFYATQFQKSLRARTLRRRALEGFCPKCGYDTHKSGAICPECGNAIERSAPSSNYADR
jgi:hypothetical protein